MTNSPEQRIAAALRELKPVFVGIRAAVQDKTLGDCAAEVAQLEALTIEIATALHEH